MLATERACLVSVFPQYYAPPAFTSRLVTWYNPEGNQVGALGAIGLGAATPPAATKLQGMLGRGIFFQP